MSGYAALRFALQYRGVCVWTSASLTYRKPWACAWGSVGASSIMVPLGFESAFEFAPQLVAVGQVKLVFRDEKLVVHAGKGVILLRAKQTNAVSDSRATI